MTPGSEITLDQMLNAREERARKQKNLILEYGLPLVSVTVNIPGAQKNIPAGSLAFCGGYHEMVRELLKRGCQPVYQETRNLVTGPEGYIVVDIDEYALKKLSLMIENRHLLGRLLDIDVIGRDRQAVSRQMLGYPKRKCLLCDKEAYVCARSRAHSIEELMEKIRSMTYAYTHTC